MLNRSVCMQLLRNEDVTSIWWLARNFHKCGVGNVGNRFKVIGGGNTIGGGENGGCGGGGGERVNRNSCGVSGGDGRRQCCGCMGDAGRGFVLKVRRR